MIDLEHILYVAENLSYKKGFLRSASANLVLTDERLIVAHITPDVIKMTREWAGGGFGGYMTALSGSYRDRYLEMEPEAIMKESPDNFSIPLREISEVRVKSGDIERETFDKIELRGRKNLKFTGRTGTLNVKEMREAFSKVGIRVKG